jgi:hypothetical protein
MSVPAPASTDIERLAATYARLRQPDNKTPAQVLRSFQQDMDHTILPCIESLDHRSRSVYDALCDFARYVTRKDKKPTDAISKDAKRAAATGEEVIQEIEEISRELDCLSDDSPKRE